MIPVVVLVSAGPVFLVLICFNFLLSYIMDAYAAVKERFQDTGNFFEEATNSAVFWTAVRGETSKTQEC